MVGLVAVAASVSFCVAGMDTASASQSSTEVVGHTSVPRIPRDGIAAQATCPADSYVVGIHVWLDDLSRLTALAPYCGSDSGLPSLADVVGDPASATTTGDSVCTGSDIATGLRGSFGEVMNSVGVQCAPGGSYDGTLVGNQAAGGEVIRADCAPDSALTGVAGWYNGYGAGDNVYGVQGLCDPATPDASAAASRGPDDNGWYNHPFTVAWSSPESDATCTSPVTYTGPDATSGSLSGTCTSPAGFVSAPASYAFRYDATAPTVSTPPLIYISVLSSGFAVDAHDNVSGVASVQATFHPLLGSSFTRNAVCTSDCGTTNAHWWVSTAGVNGIFGVTFRATDTAGNVSAHQ
jgi:hypothetical protein